MPVYNVPNLASNNRSSPTQQYYTNLNRPNPVGNQLGNQTGTTPQGPQFFNGGGWTQGQDANPFLQQYLNGRNPYGRSGFNIENTLARSQTGVNQFGDPRLAQYGYSFGPGAGSESGSENAWRGDGTLGLDQRGLINRNGTAYAQVGEIMDRIIDPTKVFYDDEFGLLTDPSNIHNPDSNMTKLMPALVTAALAGPVAFHAAGAGVGAGAGAGGGGSFELATVGESGGSLLGSGTEAAATGVGTASQVGVPNAAAETAANAAAASGTPPPGYNFGPLTGPAGYEGAVAASSSSLPFGLTARDLMGGASALWNIYNSRNVRNDANAAANRADPFGQYRGRAGEDLMKFMQDPSYIYDRPGYLARRNQGEQGINRAAAGKGYFRSPNMLFDLSKFNSDLASQEFDAEYRRLASMAGVDINPGTAAQIQANGSTTSNNMRSAGITQLGSSFFDWLSRQG